MLLLRFRKKIGIAEEMPDDPAARSHKRERDAYAQRMKATSEDEDDEDNDELCGQD